MKNTNYGFICFIIAFFGLANSSYAQKIIKSTTLPLPTNTAVTNLYETTDATATARKMGIGTSSPTAVLDVCKVSQAEPVMFLRTSQTDQSISFISNGIKQIYELSSATGSYNYFQSKLGIGVDPPIVPLHVNGAGLFTDKIGIGSYSTPGQLQYQLQIKSADTVTMRFDPAGTKPVRFVNSAEASCFQFWSLRDNANPIEKGDGSEIGGTGYSKILAFTINPTGEIVSKYAVVQNSITTAYLGASKSIASPMMVTDTFQLRTNAGEGKLMVSDRSGVASWADMTEIFPQYWQSNGNGGIYTDKFTVGIKTGLTGPYDLAVNGVIGCKELKVEINSAIWNWPDYVFAPGYHLPALADVEQFVKENGHLPEVPSAESLKADGISVGEMQATLLKKVEELTLYLIDQQKTVAAQQQTIESQREALAAQQEQINQLKALIQNR